MARAGGRNVMQHWRCTVLQQRVSGGACRGLIHKTIHFHGSDQSLVTFRFKEDMFMKSWIDASRNEILTGTSVLKK